MAALSSASGAMAVRLCCKSGRVLMGRSDFAGQAVKVGALGLGSQPVANLTATHGEPFPRAKPWPYKTRKYRVFHEPFDKTTKRMNDNSKVILVEGNIGIDKAAFAKDVAREFDFHYVPEPCFDDIFTLKYSEFDVRELDEQLPKEIKSWDLKRFYADPAETKASRVGMSQIYHYINRFFTYARGLQHLLNTGQGVIMVRSPFSDVVFADAMRKFGYFTAEGHKYYNMVRDESVCEMLKPHVVIYLDAPVRMVREAINKRNIPYEVNSKVLSDEYIQTISDVYKNKLLPILSNSSEILTYNLEEGIDMEVVTEDLERLNLDEASEEYPRRFRDWTKLREDEWAYYRKYMGCEPALAKLVGRPLPWEAPELMVSDEAMEKYEFVAGEHPDVLYAKGFNPEKNNVWFKL